MASVNYVEILSAQALTSAGLTSNGKSLEPYMQNFVAHLKVTALGAGATVDGTIEHSPDGQFWETLASFDALTSATSDLQQITVNVLGHVRCVLTCSGGAATATVDVRLYYDKVK